MMVDGSKLRERLWAEKERYSESCKLVRSAMDAGIAIGLAFAIQAIDEETEKVEKKRRER